MSYVAANGQEITEEMIDTWCAAYEKGEFPEGEHTTGEVVFGTHPLSTKEQHFVDEQDQTDDDANDL